MKTALDYFRLCIFLGAAFIGVQVPSFVEQYGQRQSAHTLESDASLREFQKDADRFFDGDIEKLIEHYRHSNDQVFADGGESIDTIYQRNTLLRQSLAEFTASSSSPYQQTFLKPVTDIRTEAWSNYDHSVRLNAISIIFALSLAFTLCALCEIGINLLFAISLWLFKLVASPFNNKSSGSKKRLSHNGRVRNRAPKLQARMIDTDKSATG